VLPGGLPVIAATSGGFGLPSDTAVPAPGEPVVTPDGLYLPSTLDTDRPIPVLLALHGMGGNGARIEERLAGCAEQNGWLLIAPSMAYRDYMDPDQVRLDEQQDLPRVRNLVATVEARLSEQGLHFEERLLVYGFSRGAQLAHRFALFYPDLVAGIASLSAGSYTLPRPELAFPFGVADLTTYAGHPFDAQSLTGKPFWIGVGADDVQPEQVPRRWDPFIGSTRVERARRFSEALQQVGADVQLNVFSGAGHEETALMRQRACAFFGTLTPVHARL
jgi:predicted esterase